MENIDIYINKFNWTVVRLHGNDDGEC